MLIGIEKKSYFIVEVFDSLVVDEGVHGLVTRLAVSLSESRNHNE